VVPITPSIIKDSFGRCQLGEISTKLVTTVLPSVTGRSFFLLAKINHIPGGIKPFKKHLQSGSVFQGALHIFEHEATDFGT
jgi:hypothetical protein